MLKPDFELLGLIGVLLAGSILVGTGLRSTFLGTAGAVSFWATLVEAKPDERLAAAGWGLWAFWFGFIIPLNWTVDMSLRCLLRLSIYSSPITLFGTVLFWLHLLWLRLFRVH